MVNDIFEEQAKTQAARPRFHPVIALIGEEWDRMEKEMTEKGLPEKDRPPPDFESFSLANVVKACKLGAAEHPLWNNKLHMTNLPLLLKNQVCEHWWTPGVKAIKDYDEEDLEEDEPGA